MSNNNFLSPLHFLFTLKRSPDVSFSIQSCNIPGLSLGSLNQGSPLGSNINRIGSKMTFDELVVTFQVDSELKNWNEIRKWMFSIIAPRSSEERKNFFSKDKTIAPYCDASILIMNAQKNPFASIDFTNVFPRSMSEINFDEKMTNMDYAKVSVNFMYDTYDIKFLKK